MKTDERLSCPSTFYNDPRDILTAEGLDSDQKMKALKNWRQTCIQLQESTVEGMEGAGNQAEALKLVTNAIEELASN
jgi:hypothetical protein